jgi:hypothetical protein
MTGFLAILSEKVASLALTKESVPLTKVSPPLTEMSVSAPSKPVQERNSNLKKEKRKGKFL